MKDAASESRREVQVDSEPDAARLPANAGMSVSLGKYDQRVRATLEDARKASVIERIWNNDASLWKQDESHQEIIRNSLGWLTVATKMLEVTGDLRAYAESIRMSGAFRHAMVCGMGGSSLCPEVLRQTFGRHENFPQLLVLDSTDPDTIHGFGTLIDPERCLFIIASKSGTTTEPLAFQKYWYDQVDKKSDAPGKLFVAITDPGSQLAKAAAADGFQRIFLNQPDIGGRYSALSYFGMVPAALAGLDINKLLTRGEAMAESCRSIATENPAAMLGAIMAECALAGRDKLTLVTDEKLSALGLWIEQLIAESTGKEGKGIVPVVGEVLGSVSTYGDDRLFVSIGVGALGEATRSNLKALEAAGHPVVYRSLGDLYDLGAEFFFWEMATAFAGWRLGINPFDQPNVQESKDATKALLEEFSRQGKLPEQSPIASDGTLTIYVGEQKSAFFSSTSVPEVLQEHRARVNRHDYIALMAYIEETPETDAALQSIRMRLRDATGCAITTGYGPRFLHSTGQLHKGGPDSGVFIQLTAPDQVDFEVPGEPYTFGILKQAQAQGDFQSLLSHGRRAIRVDLGSDTLIGLARLQELIDS